MLQDLRFALRLLNAHRAYTATAVLTLALGIGANTAIFGVADSILFRRLTFADSDRLFALRIADATTGATYGTLAGGAVDAALATGLFDGSAAVSGRTWRAYVREGTGLEPLTLAPASRAYFELLDVRPALGRRFEAGDEGARAILLTHRAWMQRYGGDPNVIGREVPAILRPTERAPLSQPPLRIVGVLAPGLRLPLVPAADGIVLDTEDTVGGPDRVFAPLVRLRPGITAATAGARLRAIAAPEVVAGKSELRLVSVREELAEGQASAMWLLLGAASIVLLVACVNLAHLILARGMARSRELGIRASLGASRVRLVRLLVAEAAAIAVMGSVAGLLIARWAMAVLAAALPPALAAVSDPAFDLRTFGFALSLTVVVTTLASLAPAARLSRADTHGGLRRVLPATTVSARGRQLLVGVECATCVLLAITAGVVGRSLIALVTQDVGFASHRLAVTFDLPTLVVQRDGMLRTDTVARSAYYRTRLHEVRGVAGVRGAAIVSAPPYSGMAPDAPLLPSRAAAAGVYGVSSGYFAAMGVPMLAGRDFTDDESFGAAPVGILNLSAARLLCGGPAECLGRVLPSPGQPARTVIGVAGDTRRSLLRPAIAAMYVPFMSAFAIKTLVIAADDTPATTAAIKQVLAASKDAHVDIRTLDEARDREISPYRFNAIVVGGFAVLTLVLALVGVYGVMAAIVGERTREYGVRLALGATPARINRQVLATALLPIAGGITAGMALAAWSSRLIASLLYGVLPLDPISFAGAAVALTIAALAAAAVPAARASRVDPIVALRAE